ncbi:hypothetical protein BDZ97DRAFT_1932088 [Flammula alnicola]|nr:hypothetical protein BDZ97DRAFT_1932088 [Flammula alnicola]
MSHRGSSLAPHVATTTRCTRKHHARGRGGGWIRKGGPRTWEAHTQQHAMGTENDDNSSVTCDRPPQAQLPRDHHNEHATATPAAARHCAVVHSLDGWVGTPTMVPRRHRMAHESDDAEEEEREEDRRGGGYARATQATRCRGWRRRPRPWGLPPRLPRLSANPKHDADTARACEDEDDGHQVTTPWAPKPATSYEWPLNVNPTTSASDTTIPLLLPPGPIDLSVDDTSPPPLTPHPR